MGRVPWCVCLSVLLLLAVLADGIQPLAAQGLTTLVLPLRCLGVSDTTAAVARDLLSGELEARGMPVVGIRSHAGELPWGMEGCDELECARGLAADLGAQQVVYGSLSKLGEKVIVRLRALRVGEDAPFYTDQIASASEEDLDVIMRRSADGIAAGRPNSAEATVGTVTQIETRTPALRAARKGAGIRAGFIFPTGDSYAGVDRLTCVRIPFKWESHTHLIETTTLLGLAWGGNGDAIEWTIFDLSAARILSLKDKAAYIGGGIGVHALHLEKDEDLRFTTEGQYVAARDQGATTLTLDAGIGLLALRTYDFEIVLDVRYHYVFENFDGVDGQGAQGLLISFGTTR